MKLKPFLRVILLLCLCNRVTFIKAQIPTRIIVNSGFESPLMGCSVASYSFYPQANVPGWKTLDSIPAPTINCGSSGSKQPYLIELWGSGFNSRNSHSGNQFAEINASAATFLYQEICVVANEVVPFSVWHLRRANSGTGEQMAAELKTLTNSNIATASTHTATSSWSNYSGNLTNNGTGGMRKYGFRAISGGSLGNLVDDVTITLKPLVDIKAFSFSTVYEADSNYLYLYLNGTLNGVATVTLNKSGTAVYDTDYTIGNPNRGTRSVNASGNITLTLPAGDYNPNQTNGSTLGLIKIPFYVVNEGLYETNETIIYTVTSAANGGNGNAALDLVTGISGQSARCSTSMSTSQFTIIDAIALPVKLISFEAEEEVGYNTIRWEVTEEENIEKYLLEYSTNGDVFAIVDELVYDPNHDNVYVSAHYANQNEHAYYRISTVDKNGNITILSDVITITKNINSTFNISPNPSNGIFSVNFFSTKDLQTDFIITDMYGKTVQTVQAFATKGDNNIPFTLGNDLANGFYQITFKYGNSSRTLRASILR
jgi:hypothetical protein